MAWDRAKPWTAPARSLVLYRASDRWRFAIYNMAGIIDGALDLSPEVDPSVAQMELLSRVETDSGVAYETTWQQGQDGWWTADLVARQK
jgi:hypothetical protein